MSSVYNPDGTIIVPVGGPNAPTAIASSTNAAPVVVTLATPAAWNDQDCVEFEGHAVNTVVNGFWKVTKIDTTHFSLNGSTGVGVGGATGQGSDYSLTPTLTLPADGELETAASQNAPDEACANFAPFLYRGEGRYRLHNILQGHLNQDNDIVTVWSGLSLTSAGSFVDMPGATALLSSAGVVASSDILDIDFVSSCNIPITGSGTQTVSVGLSITAGFGSPATVLIAASTQFVDSMVDDLGNPAFVRVSLKAATSGFSGPFQIGIQAAKKGSHSPTLNLMGSYWLVVKQYRKN